MTEEPREEIKMSGKMISVPIRSYPPESSWNDPPTAAQIASMNRALMILKRPLVTEMNRPETKWQARDAMKELWDEVKDGPRVKAALEVKNMEAKKGKEVEVSLKELRDLLPTDIRQGYTNAFEEEMTLILRNAKTCEFDEIVSSLMNVGWWSQEISGRLNILEKQGKVNPQERLGIGYAILDFEHTLVSKLKEELAKSCNCKLV